MLKTLRIRNLAVIEDLTVEFGPGLNLLTGETGAGKSIVVDALGLAAGDRADTTLLRTGEARAVVEAVFDLPRRSPVRALLVERGVDFEGDELVVRREVSAASGGRVFLNGSPSTVGVLREAGDLLVELHGQHEHQSLLSSDRQREVLDQFGAHERLLKTVASAYEEVKSARAGLEDLVSRSRERAEAAEVLRRRIAEIDAVGPSPGELDRLIRERRLLRNAGRVAELLDGAVGLLYEGEQTAASLAAAAARRAAELGEIDPELAEIGERVDAARVELEEAGAGLRDYRDRTDFDPSRLEQVESRRAALEALLLRHGPDEEAALRRRDEAAAELERLGDLDRETAKAEQTVARATGRYVEAAVKLGRSRRRTAERMGPEVEGQFRALALESAKFLVRFAPSRGESVRADCGEPLPLHLAGAERVEFLLTANPGEAPRPLAKVASGGELSRVMLGLHVVLEEAGGGRVLVFDEVDAGVGGAVADALGARLARLARRHQVLCVTHLPQVAAHADRHYHVRKYVDRRRTRAEVLPLSDEQRVDELARMLGGREMTAASRRNAEALLAGALGARSRRGA